MLALSITWIPLTTARLPVSVFTVRQGAVMTVFTVLLVVMFLLCHSQFLSVLCTGIG